MITTCEDFELRRSNKFEQDGEQTSIRGTTSVVDCPKQVTCSETAGYMIKVLDIQQKNCAGCSCCVLSLV